MSHVSFRALCTPASPAAAAGGAAAGASGSPAAAARTRKTCGGSGEDSSQYWSMDGGMSMFFLNKGAYSTEIG